MNRTRIAGLLVLVGGSIAGGFAALSSLLSPSGPLVAECQPPDGDCVLAVEPRADQCAVLLEGGGDRPGEVSGLEVPEAAAARALFAMMEAGAINGFHTIPKDTGCQTIMALSREQAVEWRETLSGADAGIGGAVDGAAAVFSPTSPVGAPIQWGGGPTPEQRTEAYSLSPTDGGTP